MIQRTLPTLPVDTDPPGPGDAGDEVPVQFISVFVVLWFQPCSRSALRLFRRLIRPALAPGLSCIHFRRAIGNVELTFRKRWRHDALWNFRHLRPRTRGCCGCGFRFVLVRWWRVRRNAGRCPIRWETRGAWVECQSSGTPAGLNMRNHRELDCTAEMRRATWRIFARRVENCAKTCCDACASARGCLCSIF
jgi:hypothetical protein